MTPRYVSSLDRLRDLPAVFGIPEIEMCCGVSSEDAYTLAKRWRRRGLTQQFGGGVYYNLVVDPAGSVTRVHEAFLRLFRRPVLVVGGAALQAGGWTTQIYRRYDVIVPVTWERRSVDQVGGAYRVHPRAMQWFNILHDATDKGGAEAIPVVPPEYALADMLLAPSQLICRRYPLAIVPPDEIDMGDQTAEDFERVTAAMKALGASRIMAEELLEPYRNRFGGTDDDMTWL